MYNLLIVDDEPLILEGLRRMIEKYYGDRFLIFGADCAEDALEIFRNHRVDLLMSDIRMPGMDGLRMVHIVEQEWPECLTIFLTGHSEFEYARQAVGSRTIGYVLKLDGDEAIRKMIDKACERMEQEYEEKSQRLKLNASWQEAVPFLRRECFRRMITTSTWEDKEREELFTKLEAAGISFDSSKNFLVGVICMESEGDASTIGQIQGILRGSLERAFSMSSALVASHILLLLAQAPDNRPLRLKGFLEIALAMCVRVGLQPPQVYLYEKEVRLEEISEVFSVLGYKRFERESEGEIVLCGREDGLSSYTWRDDGPVMGVFNVERISDSLVYGKEKECIAVMEEIRRKIPEDNPAMGVTVYMTLSSLILQAILNYLPKESGLFNHINLERMSNYSSHRGFQDACYYLETVAEQYFATRQEVHTDTDKYIVHKVNSYILAHLADDLSMSKIGEMVGLHPSYLARLYRKVTDSSLGQYITAQRLNAAKSLLSDPKIRIQTVAEKVGMNSASYFTNFFKKSMGMSPQEYRLKLLGQNREDVDLE